MPSAAVEVYHEGFESGTGAQAISLRNYVGAQGETYTSDPYWVRQDQCNGVVVRYASATFPSGFCTTGNGAQNNVRRLADVLGQVKDGVVGATNPASPRNGSTAATQANHAVTAWTGSVAGPNGATTLETPRFDLAGTGARFYTASVNVAEVSCTYLNGANNSRLNFSLIAGDEILPLTQTPIRACTDPKVRYYTSPTLSGGWSNGGGYVAAGRFFADSSYLVDPAVYPTLAMRMSNAVGASQGNDFAYDEVRLYDATPQLDKSFSPRSVPVNGVSTLTLTVTNTEDLARKAGWSFTDTLPDGLVVADPANIGGTCDASVDAASGSGVITITDGVLATGEVSCTITIDVTSASPGPADESPVVYANCAENMELRGLNPPNCAEVEFYTEPHLTIAKSSNGDASTRVGDTVSYSVTATSDGTRDYADDVPAVVVDDLSGVLDDGTLVEGSLRATVDGVEVDPPIRDGDRLVWQGALAVGSSVVITYDVELTGGGDMRVANTAFPSSDPYDPVNPPPTPRCGEGGSVCTELGLPGITIVKSAQESSYEWGSAIGYRFVVTNTGAVALTDVSVDEVSFDGSGEMSAVVCPATTLRPGQSMTCTATYTASASDTDQGALNNTAVASGAPPGGGRIESEPDEHTIPANQRPAIEIDKLSDTNEVSEAGQEITYWFHVMNRGNVTLTGIVIDEVEFSGAGDLSVTCPRDVLAAYDQMYCSATYTVTQEDVDEGQLTNTARVTGTAPDGRSVSHQDTVRTPGDPQPELTLDKLTTTDTLEVGEEVTYWFRIRNTGNMTLETPEVSEVSFSGSGEMSEVACDPPEGPFYPTVVMWCSATYTVTQADVDSGRVDNTAVATAQTAGDEPIEVRSNEADASIPGDRRPGIELEKTADRDGVVAGQPITYSFTITNTGNVTIGNLRIEELDFSGSGELSDIVCPENAMLAPREAATCTATYTPTQADVDAGPLENTAVAYGTQPGGAEVVSDPDEVAIPDNPTPALTIVKSSDTQELVVGETITYSFAVENTGNVTLTDVTVVEGDFDGADELSEISCPPEASSLAPGRSVTCTATYTVHQFDVDQGSITNSATARGTPPGGGDPVVSPPDDATVSADRRPSLTLDKTADTPTLIAGETITYSFLVTNTGNVTLRGILITEEEWTGRGDAPEIVCPGDEASFLAPGRSVTCTAEYEVTQADVDAGSVYNQAVASGKPRGLDPVFSEPSDVTVNADPDPSLGLVKSSDATELVAGETIVYTFVVTNTGNVTMTDIAIREDAFSGAGTISEAVCEPAEAQESLAPGEQVQCRATYEVQQADVDAGAIENTATALGTPAGAEEPVESNPSDVRLPQEPRPAIEMVKTSSTDTLVAGETITYSFRVTNTGNVTLRDVGIAEGEFTGSGDLSAVTCPDAATALAPGRVITCTATYAVQQADVDAGSIRNTAAAEGTPPGADEPIVSEPSGTEATAEHDPSLAMVKSADPERYVLGETVTYSFVVTNTGNVTLSDVSVTEGDFSGSGEISAIDCPASSLAPGRDMTCTATYVPTQEDVDRGSITNAAIATGTPPGGGDPVTSEPSEVEITADPAPGISLVKTADREEFAVGDTVTYTFTVQNTGNVTLRNVTVNETGFSGTGELSEIVCGDAAASLAPGRTVTCTATYEVQQADVDRGSITNAATATGTPPGGGDPVTSEPSEITIPHTPAPALTLDKTADTTVAKAGDTITYTFTITNTGNITLHDITINETAFTGTGPLSPLTCNDETASLAPGKTVICTATYEVTDADTRAGHVTNTATATGITPGSETPITTPPSKVTITITPPDTLPLTGGAIGLWALTTAGFAVLLVGAALLLSRRRRVVPDDRALS